jgi:hypothetical protein
VIRDSVIDGRDVPRTSRTFPAVRNEVGGTKTITGSVIRRSPGSGILNAGALTVHSSTIARNERTVGFLSLTDGKGAGISNSVP